MAKKAMCAMQMKSVKTSTAIWASAPLPVANFGFLTARQAHTHLPIAADAQQGEQCHGQAEQPAGPHDDRHSGQAQPVLQPQGVGDDRRQESKYWLAMFPVCVQAVFEARWLIGSG
ncbi:hypothetical protein AAFF_G00137510 [Aldrovandia affinis]|uniref:Uncharacterized protein n=1 Tax=Aldrovandia affinis TaxID=143900 RepID=A0AAD7TCD9_9TELE|nr:hypothetical protein AAFF_G00137510 [Aldrovandia affinis]